MTEPFATTLAPWQACALWEGTPGEAVAAAQLEAWVAARGQG